MNDPSADNSTPPKSPLSLLNPATILSNAIKAVPAVKFALGVAGIGIAVAIVAGFITDYRVAVFGIVIMFGFMTVLVVFSALARTAGGLGTLALVLAWAFVILIIVTAFLMLTSFFFHWPQPFSKYVAVAAPSAPTPTSTPNVANGPANYTGKVIDENTSQPIPKATVTIELDDNAPQSQLTDSDGIFQFMVGGTARAALIRVKAEQYTTVERRVTVPQAGTEPIGLRRTTRLATPTRSPGPTKRRSPCTPQDILLGKC